MSRLFDIERTREVIAKSLRFSGQGKVSRVVGLIVEGVAPGARVGSVVNIHPDKHTRPI